MSQEYPDLCRALTYKFKQYHYLTTALTHCSMSISNNERLEFLGDALLSCIIAEALFARFPAAREGELTRLRASLVKRDTLVKIAQQLDLRQYLRLGGGELKTGGEGRASILADAVEAIIGAIYLDGGMEACKTTVLRLWKNHIVNISSRTIKDSKTLLQEYLQSKQQPLPTYQVLTIGGTPHAQQFKVECIVTDLAKPTIGHGENRRRAEQDAAAKALRKLNVE